MKKIKLTLLLFLTTVLSCDKKEEITIKPEPITVESIDPNQDQTFKKLFDSSTPSGRIASDYSDNIDWSSAIKITNHLDSTYRYTLNVNDTSSWSFTNVVFKANLEEELEATYFMRFLIDEEWLEETNYQLELSDFTGKLEVFNQDMIKALNVELTNGAGYGSLIFDGSENGRTSGCGGSVDLGGGGGTGGGSGGSSGGGTGSSGSGGGDPCIEVISTATGLKFIDCSTYYSNGANCDITDGEDWGGDDGGSGDGNGPIGILLPESIRKAFALKSELNLTNSEVDFLADNESFADEVSNFLNTTGDDAGSKNLANKAIDARINGGTVDFDERLVYDPSLDQDYTSMMAEQEKQLFDGLNSLQKSQYLISAQQAWNYAESYYSDTFYNGLGDAVRHSFWNALSTVRLGEDLTKQLTDAHETKPPTYEFSHKEVEMDLHNNAEGRLIAFMAGKLYLLIENALSTGELRYLTNLTGPLAPKQGRATSASQLIPTNE